MNDRADYDLEAKIDRIAESLTSLERFVDTNDQQVREILNELKVTLEDLKTLVYGSTNLRYQGLVDRIGKVEGSVSEIISSRKSERDQLKGIKYILIGVSVTGLGTWASILSQIFK